MEARPLYEAKVTKTNKYSVMPIINQLEFDLFSGRIEDNYAIFDVYFETKWSFCPRYFNGSAFNMAL